MEGGRMWRRWGSRGAAMGRRRGGWALMPGGGAAAALSVVLKAQKFPAGPAAPAPRPAHTSGAGRAGRGTRGALPRRRGQHRAHLPPQGSGTGRAWSGHREAKWTHAHTHTRSRFSRCFPSRCFPAGSPALSAVRAAAGAPCSAGWKCARIALGTAVKKPAPQLRSLNSVYSGANSLFATESIRTVF